MRMRALLTILAFTLLVPLSTRAAETVKTVNYHTAYRQTQPMQTAGEYTGRMTLHFYADGTINGLYRDESNGGFRQVSGGLRGSRIWLSFGTAGHHQLSGTIEKGGVISGSLTNFRGPNVYAFRAVPAPE